MFDLIFYFLDFKMSHRPTCYHCEQPMYRVAFALQFQGKTYVSCCKTLQCAYGECVRLVPKDAPSFGCRYGGCFLCDEHQQYYGNPLLGWIGLEYDSVGWYSSTDVKCKQCGGKGVVTTVQPASLKTKPRFPADPGSLAVRWPEKTEKACP